MPRLLLRLVALPVAVAASFWFAVSPAWSLAQAAAFALTAASATVLLGGLGALFVLTGMLAARGSNPHGGAFVRVLCPLVAMLSMGGVLACLVLRNPRLGKRIEHGPLGPGGI